MRAGARRAVIAVASAVGVASAWIVFGSPLLSGELGHAGGVSAGPTTSGAVTTTAAGSPSPGVTGGASPSPTTPPANLLPLHGVCQLVSADAISSSVGSSLRSFDDQPHGLDQCSVKNDAGWSVTYQLGYSFPYDGAPADAVRAARSALDPAVKATDLGLGDASFRTDESYSGFWKETATQVAVGQFAVSVRVLSPIDQNPAPTAMMLTTTLAGVAAHAVQVGWAPPADWVAVAGS